MPSSSFTSTRRGFLQAGAAGMMLGQVARPAHADVPALDQYKPVYLTADEFAFIMAATARLIPSGDGGPGAIEARVPVFIDLQLAGDFGKASDWYMQGPYQPDADPLLGYQTPLTPAEVYREGIKVFREWAKAKYGAEFKELKAEQQDEALKMAEANKDENDVVLFKPELRDFFSFLLQNTKEGYFADPMYGGNHGMVGWKHIGFPGARASYTEWVGLDAPYPLGPVSIKGERG